MNAFIALTLYLVVFAVTGVYGQNSVVIGTMVNKPNALLVLNPPGANQGFLLPQLSTSSRLSITPSANEDGLIVFDNDEKEFYHWKRNQWVKGLGTNVIPSQTANAGKFLTTNGTEVSWTTLAVKVDNSTINFNATDQLQIANNAVSNVKIADNAITTNKIADGSVSTNDLASTTVVPGTYGSASSVSQFTVDAKGRITSAANVPISGAGAPTLQYYSIDPSDFRSTRNAGKKDHDNGIIFDDNTTFISVFKKDEAELLIAPLHLPDGAVMQQILLYYMDKEVRNLTLNVYRKPFAGNNEAIISSWTSTGSSASIQTSTHTLVAGREVIDNSLYTYRIVVQLDITDDSNDSNDADHRVYGVRVRYLK